MADTPRGTYFFIFYRDLTAHEGRMVKELDAQRVNRYREGNAFFEVHLLKVGPPIILGFASENDALRIGSPTTQIKKISIASAPWKKMTSLISLSADRIVSAETRTVSPSDREWMYILDCDIR